MKARVSRFWCYKPYACRWPRMSHCGSLRPIQPVTRVLSLPLSAVRRRRPLCTNGLTQSRCASYNTELHGSAEHESAQPYRSWPSRRGDCDLACLSDYGRTSSTFILSWPGGRRPFRVGSCCSTAPHIIRDAHLFRALFGGDRFSEVVVVADGVALAVAQVLCLEVGLRPI
jgi:hypothetical protein